MARRKKKIELKHKAIVVSGKRKRAVARATIKDGKGEIKINARPISLLSEIQGLTLKEPIIITQKVVPDILQKVNIEISVRGGGTESQIEASRLAIARALVAFTKSKELRDALISYDRHLLIADVRRKEARKPGDSKARKKRQSSKR